MNTSFQLGLELTNVLSPLTSAISAFGSLALVKAIKKAGSDALTELELASFLGRNRIDQAMQLHFRQIVARSEQRNLSRYLDIVLEAGAGPTVQNALKDPELLSMVIQLSVLCSAHESDTLALSIVEAIRRNLKELKTDFANVPHYPSLCGTLRVCKQETASFQWCLYYDMVEKRIESNLADDSSTKRRRTGAKSQRSFRSVCLHCPSIANRTLPFPVLQVLLLCLHSLQHFPEERLLNIECTSGITTVIVWCYYVLGLNVKLILEGHEIDFGQPSTRVFIQESSSRESSASLLHPTSQHEPLFSLTSSEGDPRIGPELRKKARGFGREVIKQLSVSEKTSDDYCNWVIQQSLRVLQARSKIDLPFMLGNFKWAQRHGLVKWSSPELYGFTEDNVARAGTFLLDLDQDRGRSVKVNYFRPPKKHLLDLSGLVVLLLSLARVQPEDLENCGELPFSTQVQQQLKNDEPCLQSIVDGNFMEVALGLTKSFDILSRFLQGPSFSEELNKRSVLVSACGWSLYFESINGVDPAEVFVSTLRIVRGVPVRDDVRKTRIIDGPTELLFSPSEPLILKTQWRTSVGIFPGVSIARRGRALIGYHEPDAFQATQMFEWQYQGCITRQHLLGFREMLDICMEFSRILPCHCERSPANLRDVAERYISGDDLVERNPLGKGSAALRTLYCLEGRKVHTYSTPDVARLSTSKHSFNECVFSAQTRVKDQPTSEAWFFYVSSNPAARWMEMCDLYPEIVAACDEKARLLLRGPETCLHCAFEAIIPKDGQPSATETQDDEYHVQFVLL